MGLIEPSNVNVDFFFGSQYFRFSCPSCDRAVITQRTIGITCRCESVHTINNDLVIKTGSTDTYKTRYGRLLAGLELGSHRFTEDLNIVVLFGFFYLIFDREWWGMDTPEIVAPLIAAIAIISFLSFLIDVGRMYLWLPSHTLTRRDL